MTRKSAPQRILLLGAHGQVGHELRNTLNRLGQVISPDRHSANLTAPETLRAVMRQHHPHIVVNAAAYTAVDLAESEPELAMTVNGIAPGVLAEEADALGACLVHYSTDYVFDGRKSAPYDEEDTPNPISVYGSSKLAGEKAVEVGCRRHLIFRTCWVFGTHGNNFLKTILRLASERETIAVVADQHGAPTSAALIAETTAFALEWLLRTPEMDGKWGVYHLAAAGETTWHGYAQFLVRRACDIGLKLKAGPDAVSPITTAAYPTRAARPTNSQLNTTKLRTAFSIDLPDWRVGVNQVLTQLRTGQQ